MSLPPLPAACNEIALVAGTPECWGEGSRGLSGHAGALAVDGKATEGILPGHPPALHARGKGLSVMPAAAVSDKGQESYPLSPCDTIHPPALIAMSCHS